MRHWLLAARATHTTAHLAPAGGSVRPTTHCHLFNIFRMASRTTSGASRAVSYTHLDVYKRQHTHTHFRYIIYCYDVTEQSTSHVFIECSREIQNVSVWCTCLLTHLLDGERIYAAALSVSRAVSYTHLDVYKRQP